MIPNLTNAHIFLGWVGEKPPFFATQYFMDRFFGVLNLDKNNVSKIHKDRVILAAVLGVGCGSSLGVSLLLSGWEP